MKLIIRIPDSDLVLYIGVNNGLYKNTVYQKC